MKKTERIGIAAASTALALAIMTGCAGQNATGDGNEDNGAGATTDLAAAQQVLDIAEAEVTSFDFPTEAVEAVSGKKVVGIPCAYAAEGCKRGVDAVEEASKLLGWEYTMIDPAGDPEKMRQAVRTATQMGVDAIFLGATPPAAVADDVAAARDAGILVLNMYEPMPDGFADANSTQDHIEAGMWNAAFLAVEKEGDAQVISVNDPEFESVVEWHQGFVDGLAELCASCKVLKDFNFEIANLQTQVPTEMQGALQANPTANSSWTAYDPVALAATPIVESSAQAEGFTIVSHNGDPAALEAIQAGTGPFAASVGYSIEWQSYASVDQALRLFAGTLTTEQALVYVPNKLLTAENITTIPWDGDIDWKSEYLELWGLN